jgi:hypothetical protein
MKNEIKIDVGITQIVKAKAYRQVLWLLPFFLLIFASISLFAPVQNWDWAIGGALAIWLLAAIFMLAGWSSLKLTSENIQLRSLKTFFFVRSIPMKTVDSFRIQKIDGTDVMDDRFLLEVFSLTKVGLGKFWLFPDKAGPCNKFLVSCGKHSL